MDSYKPLVRKHYKSSLTDDFFRNVGVMGLSKSELKDSNPATIIKPRGSSDWKNRLMGYVRS